jgi:hypothetical protein
LKARSFVHVNRTPALYICQLSTLRTMERIARETLLKPTPPAQQLGLHAGEEEEGVVSLQYGMIDEESKDTMMGSIDDFVETLQYY